MKDYIICTVFWSLFIVFIYALGNVLIKGKESQAYKFTVGYLFYSFCVAVPGMVIQILNLPWIVFAGYMGLLIVLLIYLIVWKKVKEGKVFSCDLKTYFIENWMLIFICGFLVGMMFFYFRMFWEGNHLDDGYYITKVSTLPYCENGFRTNYSVGVPQNKIDSYVFNTWELEASFFVKVLGVKATLYLRLFQSAFHYFLCLNCIYVFITKIMKAINNKISQYEIQFIIGLMPILFMFYLHMEDSMIFYVGDMFHNNTGMFLGAALTKVIAIIMLLMYFVDQNKLSWKMVGSVIAISVVLVSKSGIVLPVILVTAVSYLLTILVSDKKRSSKIFAFLIFAIYLVLSIVIPGVEKQQDILYSHSVLSLQSYVLILAVIIFIMSFVFLREEIILRTNFIILVSGLLMFVPELNDLFEQFCVYGFVAGRAWATLIYTFVALNACYLYLMLRKVVVAKKAELAFGALSLVIMVVLFYGYDSYGGDIYLNENSPAEANVKTALQTMYHNRYFVPNTTIELGEKLEQLYEETGEEVYAVSPEVYTVDNTPHTLSVQLRYFAPDIVSVSAADRYPVDKDHKLHGYTQEAYYDFLVSPNDETAAAFREMTQKYGVNCVVIAGESTAEYLEEMGYQKYSTVADCNIWYK